ncbi:ring finger domain-containing protein [Fusarium heterosporum]|uniref:Ring finger domain-containing protein n=1 Tax=Fusarium heterosporum TaxID=42747 RepID=A0A8H5TXU6_FUSHE|nr:ring finger domain-containing protein [Fusarium heterosporum]
MRPPRVFVLILFIAASLLIFCRAISSSLRSAYADYPAGNFRSRPKATSRSKFAHSRHDDEKSTKNVWGSMYYNTPFSLFPPNAAISLTDDNSTSFAARPAAFGPKLVVRGLSGQLWVGSGFAEDALIHGTGELGCSDTPGWNERAEAIALHKALRAAVPSVATSKSGSSARAKRSRFIIPNAGNGHTTSSHVSARHDRSEIDGKVALLMRGGCGFLDKVMWAQRRGAVAVIVGDNQKGGPLIQMFAHGPEVDNVTIPSVFTARTTAQLLSALTQPGSFVEDTLDNQGNPVLRVQRGPKSKKHHRQGVKSTITASTHDRRSFDNTDIKERSTKPAPRKRTTAFRFSRQKFTKKNKVVRDSPKKMRSAMLSEGNYDDWKHAGGSRKVKPVLPPKDSLVRHSASADDSMPDEEDILVEFLTEDEENMMEYSVDRTDENLDDSLEAGDDAHEGLWVTITPTSNASPFFDTLLVLVISPLVTLTVVYALLILRARIRRRRWRAPKSVVERLPVRTFHTVAPSPTPSPRSPSPPAPTPTTPLLQESPARSRPRSRGSSGAPDDETRPAPRDAIPTPSSTTRNNARSEREKGSGGFSAEWKKYMGRQVECVVCLEEYVDGVSQVMSLPCGHEFHVECITPWLTTRRRTCPICKGDVVRSLAHGSSSGPHYEPYRDDASDEEEDDEEETVAEGSGAHSNNQDPDLEQGVDSTEPGSSRWGRHDGWFSIFSNNLGRARSPTSEDRSR